MVGIAEEMETEGMSGDIEMLGMSLKLISGMEGASLTRIDSVSETSIVGIMGADVGRPLAESCFG